MYAKLDRLRAELEKAKAKRDEAEEKVKQLELKLKKEESQQIVNDVASYNLSPEQLAQFLQMANSGKLQELLSGQVSMPVVDDGTAEQSEKIDEKVNLYEEKKEEEQDEE